MTLIEEALRSILLADSTLSAYVGTRIYPVQLPLDCVLPALAYSEVSNPYRRITGNPRFQIDIFSEDYTEAKNIRAALGSALDGYSGTVAGCNIEIIVPLDSQDDYDSAAGVFHIPYDFKIIYRK
jgi:hypothetical protein